MVLLLRGEPNLSERIADVGRRYAIPAVVLVERVLVLVEVDAFIRGERHGIGAVGPRAAEELRMEELERERLPAARRPAGEGPRPGLPDDAKPFLDFRNQLLHQRVAVRTDVRGVHRVGVVEVGVRMLEGNHDHPREVVLDPVTVELTALFESQGRLQREMSLVVDDGIGSGLGRVVAGQEHGRSEMDGAAPELREHGAFEAESLHPTAIGWNLDRRDTLVGDERDPIPALRVEPNLPRGAVQDSRERCSTFAPPNGRRA